MFSPSNEAPPDRSSGSLAVLLLMTSILTITFLSPSAARDPNRRERGFDIESSDDSTYTISAGSTTFREEAGENLIELSDGVEIIHGKVRITSKRGVRYTERDVTYLIGDVQITQENLRMRGEECEYRRAQDMAILRRKVKIHDRGWDITCKLARLYRRSERVHLIGEVVAADSTTTLKADSIYYDSVAMTAEVFGRVEITNLEEGFTAHGRHGYYFREDREGIIDRLPHLIVDPHSDRPATVDSDTMRFYPDRREAIAYGRVKILKGETVTQCDSAVVFDEEKRAELYGSPLARQGRVAMQGRRMLLWYSGSEVERITIEEGAGITEEQADTLVIGRDNWIRGDVITLFLSGNDVDSITVSGTCTSEYHPFSSRKVESNFVKGDSMYFTFEMDSLSYVKIIGKAEGLYRYVNLDPGETCDTLRTLVDTSLVYVPFESEAEDVSYSADMIEYFAASKDIVLETSSKLRYRNRTLLGDTITYNSTLQLLDAKGAPVLIEGNERFYGSRMDYDLESGIGLVRDGSTRFQDGFYYGKDVAKVGEGILKVWNSTYTTCDLNEPHYHFASKEMKLFIDDKVISGPIWLYIGKTPVAYLPFLANNISKERRSGFLRPEFEFGITKSTGRFIRNFGYYWATNDYTDFTFMGDFNEDASFRLFVDNRYKVRYLLDGSARFSFFRDLRNYTNEWMFSSKHRQTLGEKFSLSSDLRFVSSDRAPSSISRIDQVADVIDRRIESKLSLRKSWRSVGFSASARRVQNLDVTDPGAVKISTTFPDVSISIPSRNLYFGKGSSKGKKPFWERFLGSIRYSPGLSGRRSTEEKLYEFKETISQNTSLSFSSPWKLSFLNISPRLSASNSYTRTVREVTEHTEITSVFGLADTTLVPASRTVDTDNIFRWSTGAAVRTNLYGTFYPEIGALSGIRHTVTPSLSYSFNPGVGGRPSSQSFSLNLTNAIDLKVKSGDKERKLSNVLIWSLSTTYNPKAPEKQGWSDVFSRVNIRLLGTNVSMNQTIDPYEGKVLSTSITSGLNLNGTHGFGNVLYSEKPRLNVVAGDTAAYGLRETVQEGGEPGTEPGRNPWNVNMSFSFSKLRSAPARATLNLSSVFQLTRKWRITYSTTYDIEERRFMGQNYSIYRDLHCWEMSFSRQKLGDEWQYYFKINIKSHPEVYVESGRRGLGRGGFGFPSLY